MISAFLILYRYKKPFGTNINARGVFHDFFHDSLILKSNQALLGFMACKTIIRALQKQAPYPFTISTGTTLEHRQQSIIVKRVTKGLHFGLPSKFTSISPFFKIFEWGLELTRFELQ